MLCIKIIKKIELFYRNIYTWEVSFLHEHIEHESLGYLGKVLAHSFEIDFAAPKEDAVSSPGTLFQTLDMTLAAMVG